MVRWDPVIIFQSIIQWDEGDVQPAAPELTTPPFLYLRYVGTLFQFYLVLAQAWFNF